MTLRFDSLAGSRRLFVTLAIALAAATVSAGVALGHRPEAGKAARLAVTVVPAAVMPGAAATARDPSLPAAADVLERVSAPAQEPSPTF